MRIGGFVGVVSTLPVLLCLEAIPLRAQDATGAPSRVYHWSVYQRFQGSSSTYRQILKLDTGVTCSLNRGFWVGLGVPYYGVRDTTARRLPSTTASVTRRCWTRAWLWARRSRPRPR